MKRQLIILLFLLVSWSQSFSQYHPGTRQIALSHSDISFSTDAFSVFNNPAGLTFLKERVVGFYYSPSLFGLSELSLASCAYSENFQFGSLSAGAIIYGFELYRETNLAFGFSKNISQNISIGLTSIYNHFSIQNYGSNSVFTFNLGCIAELSKSIKIGLLVENITRSSISKEEDQIPVTFNSGIGYKTNDYVKFYFNLRKELHYNPTFSFGAEISLIDFLMLRLGASNEPDIFTGGFGIKYSFVQAEYAVISHPELGFSHQFGIIVSF